METHGIGDWDEFGISADDFDKFLDARAQVIRADLETLAYYPDEIDLLYGAGNEEFIPDND